MGIIMFCNGIDNRTMDELSTDTTSKFYNLLSRVKHSLFILLGLHMCLDQVKGCHQAGHASGGDATKPPAWSQIFSIISLSQNSGKIDIFCIRITNIKTTKLNLQKYKQIYIHFKHAHWSELCKSDRSTLQIGMSKTKKKNKKKPWLTTAWTGNGKFRPHLGCSCAELYGIPGCSPRNQPTLPPTHACLGHARNGNTMT